MIALDGQPALSPFRLERLNSRLAARGEGGRVRAARHVYFITASDERELDVDGLARVLRASPAPAGGASAWVLPRIGTRSPWSSKATDILIRCGFAVERVERGTAWLLDGAMPGDASRDAVLQALHDPMTETVVDSLADTACLFEAGPPGPLERIVLGNDPVAALAAADARLGLALADDEIEYLAARYGELGRDPTDAELMMFAQANSEHCRHKIFNARFLLEGVEQERSLFGMIRHTHAVSPAHTLSAYHDNAAVIAGGPARRLQVDPASGVWTRVSEDAPYAIKVETHNHPTAIAPHAGAATGSGGEIRDEGATGRGGKPKAGLAGFSLSHLRIPGLSRPWEDARPTPPGFASAFEILRDGPLGSAAYNNEFGRPCLGGYLRSFEQDNGPGRPRAGYDKPIMIAGGLAAIRPGQVDKLPVREGDLVIVLGGPAMLIGLGGGAASSVAGGTGGERDFSSVQRDNPEMQRRCQEVIEACRALGPDNPIRAIHDVGAGGLSNAIPEILNDSDVGGQIDLAAIPLDDPQLSPMQVWCNESQERYVLALAAADLERFDALCRRERCPFAVVGRATAERRLVLEDTRFAADDPRRLPIDLPMGVLFGSTPKMVRDARALASAEPVAYELAGIALDEALPRVLRMPAVGSKSFLITIGDRSVGGLVARDQMVGPWQVPVADCAVMLDDFDGYGGQAMAMAERAPLALIDAAASARMAVGEALTNLASAPVRLDEVRLSANWMAAAGEPGQDAALYQAVHAVAMELCPALGVSIPVGKDSLSMQVRYQLPGDAADTEPEEHHVVSPLSLVVSAFARCRDVRATLTPELCLDEGDTSLWLLAPSGAARLGGSALLQAWSRRGGEAPDLDDASRFAACFAALQDARAKGLLLACHDRSDGGLLTAAVEMAFAGGCGLELELPGSAVEPLAFLFNEELGWLLQVRDAEAEAFVALLDAHGVADAAVRVGRPRAGTSVRVLRGDEVLASWDRARLMQAWSETSHAMQRLRDNPDSADAELAWRCDVDDPGVSPHLGFDPAEDIAAPFIATGARPRVAILREQGVNGQAEMAAAFDRAGFEAVDVHMTDLETGRHALEDFRGLAICGGFSFGDVLGAGSGWATSILYNPRLRAAFASFFADPDRFALGACNGCQTMSQLKALIPGAGHWPRFVRNTSEQYEARLCTVEVMPSDSIFLAGMEGSRLPAIAAHGEGRVLFAEGADAAAAGACLRYVDNHGAATERFPLNPNGSAGGLTGFTAADGRVLILMPHPERTVRTVQMSWAPRGWGEDGPWLRVFRNARAWVG